MIQREKSHFQTVSKKLPEIGTLTASIYISRKVINNITTCMYFLKNSKLCKKYSILEIQLYRLLIVVLYGLHLLQVVVDHCQQELSCFNNNYYCYSYVSTPTLILIKLCTLPICLFFGSGWGGLFQVVEEIMS